MSLIPRLVRDFTLLPDRTPFTLTADVSVIHDMITLSANGAWARNVFAGSTPLGLEIDASGSGTFDLPIWLPILIDNAGNRITSFDNANGGTLKVQWRFLVRVSDAAITATPVVYDITAAAPATTSGAAACSATNQDYSGTAQMQTLALTLPSAAHLYRPRVTIGGTPAPGLTVRAAAVFDCYIDV